MRFKGLIMAIVVAGLFAGCSSPQKITLKNNTVIETKDEVKYNKKTGFYEYEDIAGKKHRVNADSVLVIEEI